jgi:hypothetical protein
MVKSVCHSVAQKSQGVDDVALANTIAAHQDGERLHVLKFNIRQTLVMTDTDRC